MAASADDGRPTGPPVRRLAVVLRPRRELGAIVERLLDWAQAAGVELCAAADEARLPASIPRRAEAELAAGCDAVLALGGDGTVLGALRLAAAAAVPVLGVNLGTLGYLTELEAGQLDLGLGALQHGGYRTEPRTGIRLAPAAAEGDASGAGAEATGVAYNDVVLSRVPGRGQAKLSLRIDGELLVRYASDGIIVATPQGSTAYSFSAGGPLVSPRARGMILTPDAPHGLFNRSVVLTEHERLELEILAPSAPVSLECDGQLRGTLEPGAQLALRALPEAARVVRVLPGEFADRARRRLGIADPASLSEGAGRQHEM